MRLLATLIIVWAIVVTAAIWIGGFQFWLDFYGGEDHGPRRWG